MNAKTAKRLRKISLGMAVQAEAQTQKPIAQVAYQRDRKGTVSVTANSWKGANNALKKAWKNGNVPAGV